jgi:hypothetical protein
MSMGARSHLLQGLIGRMQTCIGAGLNRWHLALARVNGNDKAGSMKLHRRRGGRIRIRYHSHDGCRRRGVDPGVERIAAQVDSLKLLAAGGGRWVWGGSVPRVGRQAVPWQAYTGKRREKG